MGVPAFSFRGCNASFLYQNIVWMKSFQLPTAQLTIRIGTITKCFNGIFYTLIAVGICNSLVFWKHHDFLHLVPVYLSLMAANKGLLLVVLVFLFHRFCDVRQRFQRWESQHLFGRCWKNANPWQLDASIHGMIQTQCKKENTITNHKHILLSNVKITSKSHQREDAPQTCRSSLINFITCQVLFYCLTKLGLVGTATYCLTPRRGGGNKQKSWGVCR